MWTDFSWKDCEKVVINALWKERRECKECETRSVQADAEGKSYELLLKWTAAATFVKLNFTVR